MLITYYWNIEGSVGGLRWKNLIEEFIKLNYDISILTFGNKNRFYKENRISIIERKNSSISNLIASKFLNSFSSGVTDSSDSFLVKLLSWIRSNFYFPDGRVSFSKKNEDYVVDYITKNNINYLITSSPPHSIHLIGRKIKKRTEIQWISDFRDPYLNWDILLRMKPTYLSKKIHSYYQNLILKCSDKIVVTNSQLKNEFKKVVDNNKIYLIYNGSNIKVLDTNIHKFKFSYFGLLNSFRDPKNLIDILDNMLRDNLKFRNLFQFSIFGNIQKSTVNYILSKKYLSKKTVFKSFISEDIFEKELNSSSLLLLLLNNSKNQNTTPYKIFDYLVSEKQILTLGDYESKDVDMFLKKFKRFERIGYSQTDKIYNTINFIFNLFLDHELNNIKMDYSELRYKSISSQYEKILISK